MKRFFIFFMLFGLSLKLNAQNSVDCDILPSISTNTGLNFYMNEISSEDYYSRKKSNPHIIEEYANSEVAEKELQKKYPDLFRMENDQYVFTTFNEDEIIVKNSLEQTNSFAKYTFKGRYSVYVFILREFYEDGNVVVVNTESKLSFIIPGKPHFINDEMLYSYSYGYGTSDLKIVDINKQEIISLSFDDIIFEDSYNLANHIFLKFRCADSKEYRYLEVLKP